jgi:lipoprotein-releasing system ATP-binding protein
MQNESVIRCVNLCKHFETGAETLKVLDGLDLNVAKREFVAITGKSGSGKSTLLSVIGGLDSPTSGAVVSCGIDLAQADERALSNYRGTRVGFVFQFHYLLKDFTALENVALPGMITGKKSGEAKERAKELMEIVGLSDREDHLPAKLSGGERQRVAIARALANSPELLLADEPTGNLDAATAAGIEELFLALPEKTGTTVLVVTHDGAFARRAGRKLELAGGKLREE